MICYLKEKNRSIWCYGKIKIRNRLVEPIKRLQLPLNVTKQKTNLTNKVEYLIFYQNFRYGK